MGNYLNHNGALGTCSNLRLGNNILGNAVGFKLASLWKIDELRAIKGGRTLLHLVAQVRVLSPNHSLNDVSSKPRKLMRIWMK